MRRPGGRPTRLTPELAKAIILGVRSGTPLEVAALAQGVPNATFWEWVRRGEGKIPDRPPVKVYVEFATAVRRAEAEAHMLAVDQLRQHAKRNPQVSLGWLKTRWPKYYAERTELSGPEGMPIQTEDVSSKFTDDEKRLLAEAIQRELESRSEV